MTFTSDYVLDQFDTFGSVFAGNLGELSFVMMTLGMARKLDIPVIVSHELGGYTVCLRDRE